jgi:hypothetical protein
MAKKKRYIQMTADELAAATREYELSNPDPKPVPVSRAEKASHDRVLARARKRAGGRPRFGLGAARVLISIERGLLAQADQTAKRRKLTRSKLIALGLRLAIQSFKRSA